ncbi:formate dehydrogenase subunit gamma, partial [Shewanella sp. 0m-11]
MFMKSLRSLFALLVIPLVLSMGLGLSASAMAADGQTNQQKVATNDVDLWRAVKAGDSGYTTAKGIETGVLINVVGNEGEIVRNKYLTPVMGITVVGVFAAFLFFYLVNGPSKLSKGFSGKMVLRWS